MDKVISYAKRYGLPALVGALLALALDKRGHVPAILKF
jgi:hypothetical protein